MVGGISVYTFMTDRIKQEVEKDTELRCRVAELSARIGQTEVRISKNEDRITAVRTDMNQIAIQTMPSGNKRE